MTTWQSMRSVMPPWPGMLSPKSLILKPRLKPEAKKPPNGAMSEAKVASTTACSCMGRHVREAPRASACHPGSSRSNRVMSASEASAGSSVCGGEACEVWLWGWGM